jgi:hypothetical protein
MSEDESPYRFGNLDPETQKILRVAVEEYVNSIKDMGTIYTSVMIDDDGGDADDDDMTKSPWYSIGTSSKSNTGTSTGTSSNTGIGTIGQTIAQQISKGTVGTTTSSGSWPFSTAGQQLLTGGQSKKPIKTSMRFIICKKDGTTLELKEQSQITPQEMIGISKFMALVSTVLSTTSTSYNINIQWSDVITSLGITNHFVAGKTVNQYLAIETDTLDIMLHDSR